MSKSIIRSIKNVTSGYSVNQVKVRNATSNDPWGPNSTEMEEIARLTFDLAAFHEIMEMVDRRLNDKGKNWRHVLKALVLLDYLIHSGSENVVVWAKENIYLIRTLREFLYVDEENKDQGANVRAKAKDLTGLLNDDERIRAERSNRSLMHSRINSGRIADEVPERLGRILPTQQSERLDPYGIGVDARSSAIDASADEPQLDPELRQAIAESKLTAAEEESRRRERETIPDEDEDLARALKLSEEEARRKQQQEYYETQRLSGQFHQPQPTSPLKLQSTGDYQSPFQSPFHTGQQQSQQQPQAANNTDLLVDIFGPTPAAASTSSPAPATSTYPQYSQPTSQTTFGAVYPQTTGSNFYNSPPTSTAPSFGNQTHSNSPFASSAPFAQPATSSTTSPFAQPATSSTSSSFANPVSSNAATSSPFAARFTNPVSSSAATSSPFAVSSGTNSPFSQPQQYPQQSSNSPFKNTSSNSPFSTAQPTSTSSAFQFQQTPTSPAFKPTTPFNTTQPVQSHTTGNYNGSNDASKSPFAGYSSPQPQFSQPTNTGYPAASQPFQYSQPTGYNNFSAPSSTAPQTGYAATQTSQSPFQVSSYPTGGQQQPTSPFTAQHANMTSDTPTRSNNPFAQDASYGTTGNSAPLYGNPTGNGGFTHTQRSSNDFSLL